MNATHLKIGIKLGRKLYRKNSSVGNGVIYMVRRDSCQGADLRAQEESTPLVRTHREHRKKEHGLHLLESLYITRTAIRNYIRHFYKLRPQENQRTMSIVSESCSHQRHHIISLVIASSLHSSRYHITKLQRASLQLSVT